MSDTDWIWFAEVIALSLISLWMAYWAVYWKRKYLELHDAQNRYLTAHERARTPWPPLKN